MNAPIDLRELAVKRGGSERPFGPRPRVITRYVLPAILLAGFACVGLYASRDLLDPGRPVTVVPVTVSTAEVRRSGEPLFKAAGWVEPRPTPVRVAALAPGVVEELLVVEDQAVARDEVIARLVDEDAELAKSAADADLALRRGELARAEADLARARTKFDQPVHLEAVLAEAEAEVARIDTELARLPFDLREAVARERFAEQDYQTRRGSGTAVSAIMLDEARSTLAAAQARTEDLRQRKALLEGQHRAAVRRRDALATQLELKADETGALADAEARVKTATAAVRRAEVALAEAELRLGRMTIRSPVDGRVLHLLTAPGSRVGFDGMPGDTPNAVVTMYQPDHLQARVDVRFEDLPKVVRGQPILIENRALPKPLEGHVLFLSSLANIQKNTLEVKVSIDDPPAVFKPDMLVDVTFLSPEVPEAESPAAGEFRLLIPEELVQDGAVWVADVAAGVARRQGVTTGAKFPEGLIEVRSGLTPASRLIVGGREGLEGGETIRVTGEDA